MNSIFVAWLTSLTATAGSLFFSEVMLYPPCVLCWYQRICMYPLVMILLIGHLKSDRNVIRYALPLSITGLAIAIYHNLLYYKILPQSAAPCRMGISCTTKFIEWFGFITIPFLSFVAFTIISTLLILTCRKYCHEK